MTSNATRWALLGATTATALGVGATVARRRRRHQPDRRDGWYLVRRGITVDRPMDALVGFWTDRERLDRALAGWATLEQLDDNRWRCVARDRAGRTGWRAEITVTGPRRLSWRVEEGPVPQQGRVDLVPAPRDRGTEIRVELRYRFGGPVRRALGLVRGAEPDQGLRDVLRRIKSLIECGQVIDTRRDPSGRDQRQEAATDRLREKLTTGGRA
ncbi:SRPBCC family protein [Micromonospora sp. KC721]|uniref:SRPBCC family protein n=1 Tax=Micromonospora sp. KC721 TaxID=2530380 RepID=UPI00104790D1|nr:SRPBCC family protein [Micromonospora sp. KC721]TDB72727.1 cyclase [Micromonospora sp. KC721]